MPEPEASEPAPLVTIAIPTYNRAELLRELWRRMLGAG